MCGISGIYSFQKTGARNLDRIEAINQSLFRRGPDGGKVYINGGVALGHRRLSIIDTSCAGDQPMSTTDGRYTIVFNGEIFNYRQLQAQYLSAEDQGSLRSHSDTEILLLLYRKLKKASFALLQGFFALSIYDNQTGELVLARDRYGKKPLLIYQDGAGLVFASEMKALLQAGIPRQINWDLLPVYLQLNYVPQPYSLVKGVRKLPPGHYLRVRGSEVEEGAYYELKLAPEKYGRYSYEQAKERLVQLMDEAVQGRLISDVPLGAFLSGGVDSSVVVALAARHTSKLRTFSIGYKDHPYFDETRYARLVADKYQTDHTVFSLSNNDFLEHVQGVLDYIDEPFADSSAIPEFILSYYTRKHVTVALSGDGGDEVFAGYNKHGAEWRMRQGGLLNTLVKAGAPLWKALPQSRNNPLTNKFRQLHRFAEGAHLGAADRYWRWASFQDSEGSMALLHQHTKEKINAALSQQIRQEFTKGIDGRDFNKVLLADMRLVLLSDMLVDGRVVDFAFSLPATYKINGHLKKRIVQDAFREHLPAEIYNRPKHGFEIPLLDWFRKELWGMIDEDLLEGAFIRQQEIFDPAAIQDLKKQLRSNNPCDSHARIWALVVFQHWWKRYIAG
jgi:asparagine synthase (glutamine-hydrolysing)